VTESIKAEYFAHTPPHGGGGWHDLAGHLRSTAKLARERGEKFKAGDVAALAGLWHDLGKFNPEFQQYLREAYEAELNMSPDATTATTAYWYQYALRHTYPPNKSPATNGQYRWIKYQTTSAFTPTLAQ
jgi:CRISPR-associated endonuclease Cas3-HD